MILSSRIPYLIIRQPDRKCQSINAEKITEKTKPNINTTVNHFVGITIPKITYELSLYISSFGKEYDYQERVVRISMFKALDKGCDRIIRFCAWIKEDMH
jgi:hypothetical protein